MSEVRQVIQGLHDSMSPLERVVVGVAAPSSAVMSLLTDLDVWVKLAGLGVSVLTIIYLGLKCFYLVRNKGIESNKE